MEELFAAEDELRTRARKYAEWATANPAINKDYDIHLATARRYLRIAAVEFARRSRIVRGKLV